MENEGWGSAVVATGVGATVVGVGVTTGAAGLWVHPEIITPAMTSAKKTKTQCFIMQSVWGRRYIMFIYEMGAGTFPGMTKTGCPDGLVF
jgi:hypothetical protein